MRGIEGDLAELLKALTVISRALPQRHNKPLPDIVAERNYSEAGKLYALHEEAIFNAVNSIRHGEKRN